MAQSGYTPILIYGSGTGGNTPSAGNLTTSANGVELALNYFDGKLFYKDNAGAVQILAVKMPSGVLPVANGGTNATATPTAGAVAYGTGTAYAFTAAGSSGQPLLSGGAGVPTFGTLATGAGGTGLTSYTAGDLLYYATGTALTKLGIGTNGQILTSSGTAPQWTNGSSISVNTATNLAGGVAGSVPYQSGAGATTFLGIGAANTVLTSSGTAPQWSTSLTGLTSVSISSSANTVPLTVSGYSLTGSNAQSMFDLSGTWNTSGTPTGIKFNITETGVGSNASSLLMDLQVGGTSRFKVAKNGDTNVGVNLTLAQDVNTLSRIILGGTTIEFGGGLCRSDIMFQNALLQITRNSGIQLGGSAPLSFAPTNLYNSLDLFVLRDAANTLAQRNGVNAQTKRIYGTYTDASNYERGYFTADSNGLTIGHEALGTGVKRPVRIVGPSLASAEAVSLLDMSQTWNTSGTPTALKLNITDTASNASSLLMDLQVGGASRFNIGTSGQSKTVVPLAYTGNIFEWLRSTTSVFSMTESGGLTTYSDITSTVRGWTIGSNLAMPSDMSLVWNSDTVLRRDGAANTLAQRNGVNAQTFRIYNTFTDASNYERGKIAWSSNVLQIGTEKAGTGTARALELQTDGTTRVTIASGGGVTVTGDAIFGNTSTGNLRVGNFSTGLAQIRGFYSTSERGFIQMALGTGHDLLIDAGVSGFSGTIILQSWASRVEQRNGTRAQTFCVYGTYTDDSNYVRGSLASTSTAVTLAAETAGTGADDITLNLTAAGTGTVKVNSNLEVSTKNIVTDGTTGTKLGTATTQKLGFWNAAPIVQPDTGVAAATVAATGAGDVVAASTTFDGYTIPQIVKALRNAGLLA